MDARGKADAQEQEQVVDGEARVLGKGPHGCSRGRGGLLRWGTTGHSRVLGTLRCLGKAQVNRGCKGWEGVCVEARADRFAALAAAGLVARTRVSLVGIPSKARPVIGGGYERVAWGVCFPGVATAQAGAQEELTRHARCYSCKAGRSTCSRRFRGEVAKLVGPLAHTDVCIKASLVGWPAPVGGRQGCRGADLAKRAARAFKRTERQRARACPGQAAGGPRSPGWPAGRRGIAGPDGRGWRTAGGRRRSTGRGCSRPPAKRGVAGRQGGRLRLGRRGRASASQRMQGRRAHACATVAPAGCEGQGSAAAAGCTRCWRAPAR